MSAVNPVGTFAIHAPVAWLGPGRLVEDAAVVLSAGRVVFAGTSRDYRAARAAGDPARPSALEPDEVLRVDGFLMPGVADRHVHLGLSEPGAVLAGGVTSVRDLGWPAEAIFPLAAASEGPAFQGPLVRATGPMLTVSTGYPTRAAWAPTGTGLVVRGPEEAAAAVAWLLERSGLNVVKVALNAEAGPVLSDEELLAICDEAHGRGAIVTAHCQGRGQAERALGAGVDEFAHAPWSERLAEPTVAAMAGRVRMVSTLDIHSYGRDTPELRTALDNLSRFAAAGGAVVYGTDLGNGPIPPGIHVGEAWHLLRAGLAHERILEAMTFRPLAPGEPGDLVVLRRSPLEDLNAFREVEIVLRGGRRFRRPARDA